MKDTPRIRYLSALRRGEPPDLALSTVAESYGLVPNVVALHGDGLPRPVPWTLREIEALLFAAWMAEHGWIGS